LRFLKYNSKPAPTKTMATLEAAMIGIVGKESDVGVGVGVGPVVVAYFM